MSLVCNLIPRTPPAFMPVELLANKLRSNRNGRAVCDTLETLAHSSVKNEVVITRACEGERRNTIRVRSAAQLARCAILSQLAMYLDSTSGELTVGAVQPA
jgi:hypothetical protein